MEKSTLVTCIFDDADSAVDAIQELRRSGFSDDQLGFTVRYKMDGHGTNIRASEIIDDLLDGTGIPFPSTQEINISIGHGGSTANGEAENQGTQGKHDSGFIIGGIIGGTLGALAILRFPGFGLIVAGGSLAATLANASSAGVTGIFLGTGIPGRNARHYEQKFQEGSIVFTIKAAEQQLEAQDILRYHRAQNIEMH